MFDVLRNTLQGQQLKNFKVTPNTLHLIRSDIVRFLVASSPMYEEYCIEKKGGELMFDLKYQVFDGSQESTCIPGWHVDGSDDPKMIFVLMEEMYGLICFSSEPQLGGTLFCRSPEGYDREAISIKQILNSQERRIINRVEPNSLEWHHYFGHEPHRGPNVKGKKFERILLRLGNTNGRIKTNLETDRKLTDKERKLYGYV